MKSITRQRVKPAIPILAIGALAGTLIGSPISGPRANADDQPGSEAAAQQTDSSGEADAESGATDQDRPYRDRPYLGLSVTRLPGSLASHLSEATGRERGILVAHVSAASPAEQAGLREHDVLSRYNDQDLYSPEQLVKRVRNERPGQEIEIEYVRAGKSATAKVVLGKTESAPPKIKNWPGFAGPMEVPLRRFRPPAFAPEQFDNEQFDNDRFHTDRNYSTEDQDRAERGTEWTAFQSLSLTKDDDGTYRAEVSFQDPDDGLVSREFSGTRQEIRDAIKADQTLPESQRKQLMRVLDDRKPRFAPDQPFPSIPFLDEEVFQWPHLQF